MEIISRKEFLENLSKKKNNLVQVKIEGKYKIQMFLNNDITKILHLFYKCITLQKRIENVYKICLNKITGCDISSDSKK